MKYNREYINILIDYYGKLLTNHQLEILTEYFVEDLSMIEISDNYNISKAAISDIINRSVKQLENYEDKLKLEKKDTKLQEITSQMLNEDNKLLKKYANLIENIEKEIY